MTTTNEVLLKESDVSATTEPRLTGSPFDPPADEAAPTPIPELEDVEKQVEHRTWRVEGDVTGVLRGQEVSEHIVREYDQKPLSYTSMIQFTGLLGRKIDEAMSGPEGLTLESVGELADIARTASSGQITLSRGDFAGIDSFVRGFAKLASYVPDIIDEAQCIWLRVPFRDRMLVREIWGKPVDEGGLSVDDGEEMLTLFIRQNYEELERFFAERLRRIGQAIQRERKRIHPGD
jgi:hypothetical protein